MITEDLVYENQEQFSLQLVDLGGGFALPNNFVRDPSMSEIIIQDNERENMFDTYISFNDILRHTHTHAHNTHMHTTHTTHPDTPPSPLPFPPTHTHTHSGDCWFH